MSVAQEVQPAAEGWLIALDEWFLSYLDLARIERNREPLADDLIIIISERKFMTISEFLESLPDCNGLWFQYFREILKPATSVLCKADKVSVMDYSYKVYAEKRREETQSE